MKIGLFQFDVQWENPEANISLIKQKVTNTNPPDLVVLPEMFLTGFCMNTNRLESLIPLLSIPKIQELSRDIRTSICGSIPVFENNAWHNRYIHLDKDENYAVYDKSHLFSMTGEDKRYKAGSSYLSYQFMGWKIRPLICFDLRFPMASYPSEPVDLLIYVANWPVTRIEHWTQLLRARAIENQCYVVGVNRVGRDENRLDYNGHSCVIDFRGDYIIQLGENESYETAEINLEDMMTYREKFPFRI